MRSPINRWNDEDRREICIDWSDEMLGWGSGGDEVNQRTWGLAWEQQHATAWFRLLLTSIQSYNRGIRGQVDVRTDGRRCRHRPCCRRGWCAMLCVVDWWLAKLDRKWLGSCQIFRAKRFHTMMHKGTFPRAAIRARKRTLVHHRAETLRAENIGALSDPSLLIALVSCV